MKILETDRLYLRMITTEDAPFMLELFNSPGWLKYIGDRKVQTVDDAVTYIRKYYLTSYKENGFGSYAVVLKDSGEIIGSCGIYKRPNLDNPDIGFAFLPDYLGKGYGYEAAKAVLDYAGAELGMTTILGFTVEYNQPSIRLLEKLGLSQKGTHTFDDDPEQLLLFST
ncbi:MAG: ribosomal-protein-alanine N-acetyltransferase [Candidatus Latescibacterota bacterium]|jgi:ribosomal-protein-alanine N-acetyltransferase